MSDIVIWIIIGLVIVFFLWRLVTARYRIGRKMLERMSFQELVSLDQDMLKKQGLLGIYKEVLKQRTLREGYGVDVTGKPFKLTSWVETKTEQQKKDNAGTTKNE